MGESAPTGRLGAPLRGAPSCFAKASSPHSTAPVGRRSREGSERPLWRGAGLPLGRFGHRQAAGAPT
eukprot:692541-Alexandrium_andersonii.AAC.1